MSELEGLLRRHSRALDATVVIGRRIIELFTDWSGDQGVSGEITRLGWLYVFHRDRADALGQQVEAVDSVD